MGLVIKDGKIVARDGKLGSGQGCCCGNAPPCDSCPDPLQVVLEITGLGGDCACLNGTYAADMNAFVDTAGYGPGGSFGAFGGKNFVLDGCVADGQTAYVSLFWQCDASAIYADIGFTVLPAKGGSDENVLPAGGFAAALTGPSCAPTTFTSGFQGRGLPCDSFPTVTISVQAA